MGESWLDRPDVEELFCTRVDPERGLRPYRLKTRNWRPHDSYKREEAMMLADESRKKLKRFYEHCVRKMQLAEEGGRDWEEPTDEDLARLEEEENENIIPFPRPDTDTIH